MAEAVFIVSLLVLAGGAIAAVWARADRWPFWLCLVAAICQWLLPKHWPSNTFTSTLPPSDCVLTVVAIVAIGRAFVDRETITKPIRPMLLDFLMLGWALVPAATALSQLEPVSEALGATAERAIQWLPAYMIGRIALSYTMSLREIAAALACAGLLFVPIVLAEQYVRPPILLQLYDQATGKLTHLYPLIFNRYGPKAHRPYLTSGELGTAFNTMFATFAFVSFYAYVVKSNTGPRHTRFIGIMLICVLIFTTISCRSIAISGFLVVGLLGFAVVAVGRRWLAWAGAMPIMLSLLYIVSRIGQLWDPYQIASVQNKEGDLAHNIGKTWSLWFRWHQEDRVMREIEVNPWLGLGSSIQRIWKDTGIEGLYWIDSQWAFTLVRNGYIGLGLWCSLFVVTVINSLLALRRKDPLEKTMLIGLAVIVGIAMMDGMMNPTPIVLVALLMGGLTTYTQRQKKTEVIQQADVDERTPTGIAFGTNKL